MNDTIETQLKTDGQAISQLAESRLQSLDLAASVESNLQPPNQSHSVKWPWAMAASVLLLMGVMWFQPESETTVNMDAPVLAKNFNDWPAKLEQGINNPLQTEQAAIIADLKTLQKQWLSI